MVAQGIAVWNRDGAMLPGHDRGRRGARAGRRVRQVAPLVRRCLRRFRREATLDRLNALIAMLAAALLLAYGVTAVGARIRANQASPVIAVQVKAGDTLWALAQRYGNPDEYILKRVQQLAERNGIRNGVRLHAGMTLQVPVENPAECTSLMTASAG